MRLLSKLITLRRLIRSPNWRQTISDRIQVNIIEARFLLSGKTWFTYRAKQGFKFLVDQNEAQTYWMFTQGHPDVGELDVLKTWARAGDFCVDVGANIGFMTALLAERVGFSGRVWAVEAGPATFQTLERNISRLGLAQVLPIHACVGTHTGVTNFYVATNSGFSPLQSLKPPEIGEAQFTPVEVRSYRIDDLLTLWDRGNCPSPALVKIDVEGFEAHALKGAPLLLSSDSPPLFDLEINPEALIRTATKIEELADLFGNRFELHFMNLSDPDHPLRYHHLVPFSKALMSALPRLGSLVAIPLVGAFATRREALVAHLS